MKSISSAIVLLSGSIIFSVGAMNRHSDTQLFVMCVGGVIGLMGLFAWKASFGNAKD